MSELYHYGIKGQRWGIRRYQNEDGSLTPEGERHLGRAIESRNKYVEANKKFEKSTNKQLNYMKNKKGYNQRLVSRKEGKDIVIGYKWFDKKGNEVDLDKLYKNDKDLKKITDEVTKDSKQYWDAYNNYYSEYKKVSTTKLGIGSTIGNNWNNILDGYDNYYKKLKVSNI